MKNIEIKLYLKNTSLRSEISIPEDYQWIVMDVAGVELNPKDVNEWIVTSWAEFNWLFKIDLSIRSQRDHVLLRLILESPDIHSLATALNFAGLTPDNIGLWKRVNGITSLPTWGEPPDSGTEGVYSWGEGLVLFYDYEGKEWKV